MKIILVGGGIIGLAVGEELLRRGVEVELFERRPELGQEASIAAAGILAPPAEAVRPGPHLDLLLRGHQMLPEAVVRLQALTGTDLEYRAGGMLGVAVSAQEEKELLHKQSWQSAVGLQVERLDERQVKEAEPAIDGPVRLGLWWPCVAQVNTASFIRAYQLLLERGGAVLHTGLPVRRFLLKKDRLVGVETDRGRHAADGAVNCAGPWAPFDAALPFEVPTFPVKGQIVQLATAKPLVRSIVKFGKTYLVQRDPRNLLVGTTVEDAGFDKTVTDQATRSILQRAGSVVSAAGGLSQTSAWVGLRPGTPDGLPLLGETPVKGLWMATGHFRNGILLAPLTGRLVADAVLGRSIPMDMTPFRVDRFLKQAVS